MFSQRAILIAVCLCLSVSAFARDLYQVPIQSQADAEALKASGAEAILLVRGGCLVLAGERETALLEAGGLKVERLAEGVEKDQLALDNQGDDRNAGRFPVLYQEDKVRLFRVDDAKARMLADGSSLVPIRNEGLVVRYREPLYLNTSAVHQAQGLQELIDKVSVDTVAAELAHLQTYNGRVAATTANYAARDWLKAKLQSYGYTSVSLDQFSAYVYDGWKSCYNVVAVKQGTVYPNRQVVVGAHFDGVPGSPAVDDNGTGSVGVLEMARALADVPTEMTFVFVLFDSEEQGLNGAWHYASEAASRGDSIVCMLNMDMIGYLGNDNYATIHSGPVFAYAQLWIELADSLVNLVGTLAGTASNSDHYAFQQNGYDVMFAIEYNFSPVYHTSHDSTTYIGYNYCSRIIKATLATAYTVNLSPLPVRITSVRDGGDGQSLQVNWLAGDPGDIVQYIVYYGAEPTIPIDSLIVPATDVSRLITGLVEGVEYGVYVVGVNPDGYRSIGHTVVYGTPRVLPVTPTNLTAMPKFRSIELTWQGHNTELDFSHYAVIRDGIYLPYNLDAGYYLDNDFALGGDDHAYRVVAVDFDGNISDTVGTAPVSGRAATLEPGRILLVNRSNHASPYMVNEIVTGEFMRDALDGYDYVYCSDSAPTSGSDTMSVNLVDMIGYEVVVLGGESGRLDDFASDPAFGGKLDTIGYYLSLGGKVVIFGRWGDITTTAKVSDTIVFGTTGFNRGYKSYFDMHSRIRYLTHFSGTTLNSDLIGAHSLTPEYPDLVWDSLATLNHSSPWTAMSGIPCPTFARMDNSGPEVIYTYDSRNNFPLTEGKPVAWRYRGSDCQYIFFEIPLSFFERATAETVLQTAVSELLSDGPAAVSLIDPDTLDVEAGVPPTVTVYVGDFGDGKTASDVIPSSVLVGTIVPQSTSVIPSYPGFTGQVLAVDVASTDLMDMYGPVIDTIDKVYTVSWRYNADPVTRTIYGVVTLIGQGVVDGDANGDLNVNLADVVYIINYIFKGGPEPDPLSVADANCDGAVNLADAVYLVAYIFRGGPPPGCN